MPARQKTVAVAHVEDDEAARLAQEEAALATAVPAPEALDEETDRSEPPEDSTLASGSPQRSTHPDEVVVVDDITDLAPDYAPVIVEERAVGDEFEVVRLNQDVEPHFYGTTELAFEKGKRYRVHREIANMLRRKEMII